MLKMCIRARNVIPSFQIFFKRLKTRNVRSGGMEMKVYEPGFSRKRKPTFFGGFSVNTFALLHRKFSWKIIKNYFQQKAIDRVINNQRFLPNMHRIYGPELSAAHFIVHHNGKVKFSGSDVWMCKDDFKNQRVSSQSRVEGIDASETLLCYEGIENFVFLRHLKQLLLRNCEYVDDWCLHRVSNLFENTLTHLDISGCHQVTEKGICTLYKLKKLKMLVLNDTPNIAHKELACILLEDVLPKCQFTGVEFNLDPFITEEQIKI